MMIMENSKPSGFENAINAINWLKIVASPTLIGAAVGFAVKLYLENEILENLIFAACILMGIVTGIIWANTVNRKYGATHFISRTDASPDIDDALNKKK